MLDGTAGQGLPVGLGFRPYRGDEDHGAMAAVRLGVSNGTGSMSIR